MALVASDGWLRAHGNKERYSSFLYDAAWGAVCWWVVKVCLLYFEIKSTWQCRRSSSEHVGVCL